MHQFNQIDVFASTLTHGNPLAVVHDADDLTDEQMAAFARWTNLAETTFLLRPTDAAADYRVRIFTTQQELPFAGHPTLGSARAWLEAGGGARADGQIVQECAAGLIRVRLDGERLAFAAPPLVRNGPVGDADLPPVIDRLGVNPDLVLDAQWADNGPGWVAVLLTDAQAVLDLQPNAWTPGATRRIGVVGAHPAGSETDFEVRAFTSSPGGEDPATAPASVVAPASTSTRSARTSGSAGTPSWGSAGRWGCRSRARSGVGLQPVRAWRAVRIR